MKKILYFLIFISLVASCNLTSKKEIISTYEDGKIATLGYYKTIDGQKIYTKKINFYPNFFKKSVEHYDKKGRKTGKWIFWYPNGKKNMIINYKEGVKDGSYIVWYQNGKKQIKGYYKHGLAEGKWKIYDENGKLISVSYYENGKLVKTESK